MNTQTAILEFYNRVWKQIESKHVTITEVAKLFPDEEDIALSEAIVQLNKHRYQDNDTNITYSYRRSSSSSTSTSPLLSDTNSGGLKGQRLKKIEFWQKFSLFSLLRYCVIQSMKNTISIPNAIINNHKTQFSKSKRYTKLIEIALEYNSKLD